MKNILLLVFSLLLAASAARAQDDYSTQLMENSTQNYNNNISTLTNGIINKSILDKAIRRNNASGGRRGGATTTAKAATARASFAYVPTAAASQAALRNQTKGKPVADAQLFQASFGPGGQFDYQALYRKVLAGSGLRDNDVADAFAAYLVASYQVAHGAAGPLLPANPAAAVRAQFAPATGRVLAGKPAATVAAIGEYLKLQTALLYVGSQGTSTATYRQGVANTLNQRFHLDVLNLTLTNQGLLSK